MCLVKMGKYSIFKSPEGHITHKLVFSILVVCINEGCVKDAGIGESSQTEEQ